MDRRRADIVQESAQIVMSAFADLKSPLERILPIPVFTAEAAKALGYPGSMRDGDLEILLQYLTHDCKFTIYDEEVFHSMLGLADVSDTPSS